MGRLTKYRKKDNKYRFWSTITDSWHSDWMSRDKAIQYLLEDGLMDLKQRMIEKYYTFPHQHMDKDTHKLMHNDAGREEYKKYLEELDKQKDENYFEFIEKTFEKLFGKL